MDRIKDFLSGFSGTCDFNETALQAKESTACGQFAVFFAIQRYYNEDLEFLEILEEYFSLDLTQNETLIKSFLASLENDGQTGPFNKKNRK